jgi:hypothetical protein
MFKTKEDQYNRIFQLFERVENPYESLLLEGSGGPSGFEDKWFDSTTGKLYEDVSKTTEVKTFNIIANANTEVRELSRGGGQHLYWNYWIVGLNEKKYVLVVEPDEDVNNRKSGSGIVRDVYYIHVK